MKPLLVVLPFCVADSHLAADLMRWVFELSGPLRWKCLLATDAKVNESQLHAVYAQAIKAFAGCSVVQFDDVCPHSFWPEAPNWMFENVSRFIMANALGPFLWLEPDCVPLKPNWLKKIDAAYTKSGKPFMGKVILPVKNTKGLPPEMMSGTAVYPENAYERIYPLTDPKRAWDVDCAPKIIKDVEDTALFHMHYGLRTDSGPTFMDAKAPNYLKPEFPIDAVVFHRCSDGSLISWLRVQRSIEVYGDQITAVITTYNRPEFLKRCFDSCLQAGLRHIVIVGMGNDQEETNALGAIKCQHPDVCIVRPSESDDSNMAWLSGVKIATTRWVQIVHDDDGLMPNYLADLSDELSLNPNFVFFDAVFRGEGFTDTSYCGGEFSVGHNVKTAEISEPLGKKENQLSITPVRGLFQRNDLIEALELAARLPDTCHYRPGFVVGNDLFIWLTAAKNHPHFAVIRKALVFLGHHKGSTTISDLGNSEVRLFGIYNRARRVWKDLTSKIETKSVAPLHIFTIVKNGMPFLTYHFSVFNRLNCNWHWHIIEGTSDNVHCTKWCQKPVAGNSTDGTMEFLNSIKSHPRVTVASKALWNGKVQMVNQPLVNLKEECILLEVDVDEFWTVQQIHDLLKVFNDNPSKDYAMFWCRYFFGPNIVMVSRNCYGNDPKSEWQRAWRFIPGMRFSKHEPPKLGGMHSCIPHSETERYGLVFDHYGYVNETQLKFKESFYGYKDALKQWRRLQENTKWPARLNDFLSWVNDNRAVVDLLK